MQYTRPRSARKGQTTFLQKTQPDRSQLRKVETERQLPDLFRHLLQAQREQALHAQTKTQRLSTQQNLNRNEGVTPRHPALKSRSIPAKEHKSIVILPMYHPQNRQLQEASSSVPAKTSSILPQRASNGYLSKQLHHERQGAMTHFLCWWTIIINEQIKTAI